MTSERILPDNPLAFIVRCVLERRILWTYHVNMRLKDRCISRQMILESVAGYEIIEANPEDKYLPSYLVRSEHRAIVFHVLFAVDVRDDNVRAVTAYRPAPGEWNGDFRRRRMP